jgi:hypothetical protein
VSTFYSSSISTAKISVSGIWPKLAVLSAVTGDEEVIGDEVGMYRPVRIAASGSNITLLAKLV